MLINEILTPGEKIKKVRKVIGASQKDIAGTQITRNLISQIENGKTKLSMTTAEIIACNINNIIRQKAVKNLHVTSEWLLEDIRTQANNIADNYIKSLRIKKLEKNQADNFNEEVKEIENFINKWDVSLERKSKIYELVSDIYFNLDKLNESFFKMQISLDLSIQNKWYEESIRLMMELSKRMYLSGGTPLEQLRAMHLALNIYDENGLNDKNILKKIYFNSALYYSLIDMYDTSIEHIEKLIRECNLSIKERLDADLLKAVCYEESNRLNEAEDLYLDTLDIALKENELTVVSKIYNSLGSLYRIKNDEIHSLEYINCSLKIQSDIKERDYAKTLYYAVYNYIEMDKRKLVLDTLHTALSLLDKTKNGTMYYELSLKLYDYFIKDNDYINIYSVLKKMEIAIKRKIISNKESIGLFFKTSNIVKLIDRERSEELFNVGINLLDLK